MFRDWILGNPGDEEHLAEPLIEQSSHPLPIPLHLLPLHCLLSTLQFVGLRLLAEEAHDFRYLLVPLFTAFGAVFFTTGKLFSKTRCEDTPSASLVLMIALLDFAVLTLTVLSIGVLPGITGLLASQTAAVLLRTLSFPSQTALTAFMLLFPGIVLSMLSPVLTTAQDSNANSNLILLSVGIVLCILSLSFKTQILQRNQFCIYSLNALILSTQTVLSFLFMPIGIILQDFPSKSTKDPLNLSVFIRNGFTHIFSTSHAFLYITIAFIFTFNLHLFTGTLISRHTVSLLSFKVRCDGRVETLNPLIFSHSVAICAAGIVFLFIEKIKVLSTVGFILFIAGHVLSAMHPATIEDPDEESIWRSISGED